VTSAAPVRSATGSQWNVNVTLNPAGAEAFGKLTTSQFNSYSAGAMAGNADDVTLASDAFVMNGDVTSAPVVEAPLTAGKLQVAGPQPAGFTKAEAAALAARLWAVPTL
jgi:preprotein translocase subunit SecD